MKSLINNTKISIYRTDFIKYLYEDGIIEKRNPLGTVRWPALAHELNLQPTREISRSDAQSAQLRGCREIYRINAF
jgi:hypothetical protein